MHIKFRSKETPFFRAGLLIISTDLFWHLGHLPIKLITDFKMSLSRSMKHDPIICVILSAFAFTFDSPNLLLFSVKDYGSLMLKLKCSHLFLFYSFPVQPNILKKHVLIGPGVFYIEFWPWHFAAFSNFLLQTFAPNLVSVTCPSLQWLGKTRRGYFRFPDFWSIPYRRKLL